MTGGGEPKPLPRVATVAVVGRTNAGKSSLVNRLVGEKVSIVSPVEQTTRNSIRGIVADRRGQLVLTDTPGLHKAVGGLGRLLNSMARASASGTDVLLVAFDASKAPETEDGGWMARVLRERPAKVVFALNKCDRSPFFETMFRDLWRSQAEAAAAGGRPAVEPVWVKTSAVRSDGCAELLDRLFELAEEGPLLFPEDTVTDYPRKLAIADVIREKFLQRLYGEVPHELGITVGDIAEDRKRGWSAEVTAHVNRPSQKGIAIGPAGRHVKDVRKAAEAELKEIFGVKVHLELWVKVTPGWMKDPRLLAEMGYTGALR